MEETAKWLKITALVNAQQPHHPQMRLQLHLLLMTTVAAAAATAVAVAVAVDALVAWQVVKVQQKTQAVLHQLEAADVLVTINSIPAHQPDVHLAIVHQSCYTVLAQHVHISLGEL